MASATPIEDPSSLPGETVYDQLGHKLGEVREVYSQGGAPMWVTIDSSVGLSSNRVVFIPIARLKQEEDQVRVPYSAQHVNDSPEVDAEDELSEEDDHKLRAYYAVGIGDGELRDENDDSYASRVPDEDGPVKKDSSEG